MKPHLRTCIPEWRSDSLPDNTAYEAGFLVTKNSGWRDIRPVIDTKKCTGCLQCYLYCPDGTIARCGNKVSVDYDFCKGCGICAKMCRHDALRMEAERR
ncbi:MAG: 4Fe-4S binding protein [Candidatus Methanoplasma sp.]|nr:4Fe-4S binding protein [Candidatus Methanoplasma sp.]